MVSTRVCGTLSGGSNPLGHPNVNRNIFIEVDPQQSMQNRQTKNRQAGGFLVELDFFIDSDSFRLGI